MTCAGRRTWKSGAVLPSADLANKRKPNATAANPAAHLNSFPRIAADPNGTIYLTFRTPIERSNWGKPGARRLSTSTAQPGRVRSRIPKTYNYIDMRAAMAVIAPGDLIADSRYRSPAADAGGREESGQEEAGGGGGDAEASGHPEGIQTDLIAAEFRAGAAAVRVPLQAIPRKRSPLRIRSGKAGTGSGCADAEAWHQLGSEKLQIMRGEFHRHTEISGDGRDGPLIDAYRYMIDAASMDWGGCCDHDNGQGREYSWWIAQKLTDAYHLGTNYVPMFSYERSVKYPEGHRNVVFTKRGIRPLPRLPATSPDSPSQPAPDTQMLYRYLRQFNGIVASHTSGTDMGTDWRDNDPLLEPVVEIYQGDRQNYEMPGAPRSNSADDSIGGWRPLGFVSLALKKGYRLGFRSIERPHLDPHVLLQSVGDVSDPRRRYGGVQQTPRLWLDG